MSDAVLTVLRLGFLALLWVFFLRIANAVWTSATPRPTVATETRSRKRRKSASQSKVVILEPVEHAGLVYPVVNQLTIGRSASCDVTLDDTFVSSQHARIARTDHGLVVSDLGSTNGTYVNREKVTTPIQVSSGTRVQIGSTVLEVR
ncbi:MAG: FHA domain-containing protein [Acidimicrobiales bacterium]|nr:FHA domain-containing protein [Acidimicrobiales bacterium]